MRYLLIVEDDPPIRETLADYLKDAGFGIVEAENGDDALALLAGPKPVDLLLSDVHMPGRLNGNKLGLLAKQLRPGLPVIHASGRPQEPKPRGTADLFIPKPYGLTDVLRAIRRLLPMDDPT